MLQRPRCAAIALSASAVPCASSLVQVPDYSPVSQNFLKTRSLRHWLRLSRSHAVRRHGPLDQLTRGKVGGETLWETVVGGTISSSTNAYAVNDNQCMAILTGDKRIPTRMAGPGGTRIVPDNNTNDVFALPDSNKP